MAETESESGLKIVDAAWKTASALYDHWSVVSAS